MRSLLVLSLLVVSLGAAGQSDFETTTSLFGDLRARLIGPATMSGRISCLAADPNDPTTVYIGAAGGGVWKTTNAGASLDPVFDGNTQSIGAIAVAPSDPRTVYVGTGEPWPRNSVSVGDGLYRTKDGGQRWEHVGLPQSEHIGAIVVHPDDPNTVFVAALGPLWSDGEERGVFKSTDGGEHWERVLYIDASTGAADISLDPGNPEVLFASMWSHRRYPYSFDSGFGGTSGLYRSTDGGTRWDKLTDGLPAETLGRIGVAVAPSNGRIVYASVETGTQDTKGLYRSDDGGDTWALIDRGFNNQIRPFYFADLTVDPSNDSIVAKNGLSGMISEDRGKTWRDFDPRVHSDSHAIWIDPDDGRHVLVGTDGGVYESRDRGKTFKMWQNLPVSQFYHVSVDRAVPYRIYGGLQDNGSWYGPSSKPGGITNADWKKTLGGDGFYSFRHPTREYFVFSEYQGGSLARYDERTGRAKMIAPYRTADTDPLRFNWNAPLHISRDGNRLYFASQYLFRSTDDGDSWERISPDLTTNDTTYQQQQRSGGLSPDNSGAENYTTIYAVAESPVDSQTVWVGTDDGNLQLTTDGGTNWTRVNPNIPGLPAGSWVTFVEASPHDPAAAYVTFDNHRRGDFTPYVYRTDDAGEHWTRLQDEDLEGYALSIRQDPVNADLLFLGTEFGLFISLDHGATWAPFRNNLPRVGIRDMVIQQEAADLVLATHGRGIAILDDLEALRQITPALTQQPITFLESPVTYFADALGSGEGQFSGSGNFVAPNPSGDARIMYYASRRHTFGKMYVEIYRDGELIRTLQAGKSAGLNLVSLPVTTRKPKAPPSDNREASFGTVVGPSLPAGTYQVKLVKGKDSYQTSFTLASDPDSPYDDAARAEQSELLQRLFDDTEQLAWHYQVLKEVEAQADSLDAVELAEAAREEQSRLVFLGGDHYINEGEQLGEEVSKLYASVAAFPGRPSVSQSNEAARLQGEVALARERFTGLLARVDSFNQGLDGETRIHWTSQEDFLAAED